jgi:hypothetical protein
MPENKARKKYPEISTQKNPEKKFDFAKPEK